MNEGDPPPRPTWARVRFERHGEGKTAVRVEHLGWGVGERWEEARAWTERAWGNALENLAAFLWRHAAAPAAGRRLTRSAEL